jgi:hypothetical protein
MNAVTRMESDSAPIPATMSMLLKAVDSGADLDRIEKLMALHERFEANEARKAFSAAMAKFRGEPMEILKTKYVNIPDGPKFHHATLANVVDGVIVAMSKFGLRHQWKTEQKANLITVTCIITHELGHSEATTLEGPPDTGGKKSAIQAIASSVSLLERYTLLAAVGLAAKDMDNDPKSEGPKPEDDAPKPSDYDRWRADTQALADEGTERLLPHWKGSPEDIRRYAITHDKSFWDDCKAKAAKVSAKTKAAT